MRIQWLATSSITLLALAFACSSEDTPGGSTADANSDGAQASSGSGTTTDASSAATTTSGSGGGASSTTAASGATDGAVTGTTGDTTASNTTAASGGATTTATSTAAATTTGGGGSGGGISTGAYDCSPAEGEVPALTTEVVGEGFAKPTFVTVAPGDDSRLFVLEQAGKIQIVEDGATSGTFLDIDSAVINLNNYDERGLLGLAFHPNYSENGLFYVHYSTNDNGATQLSEFKVSDDPNVADPNSERTLISESQLAFNHNGGMLAFGPDGYLHFGLGDGGDSNDTQNNAQNLSTIKGSLLRIDVDGRDAGEYGIPAGNMTGANVAPEILDYGLRNPWRFSFDPCTGDIYIGDVGQDNWEEVDVRPAGTDNVNWGWSVKEGMGCCQMCANGGNTCDEAGLTDPVIEYGRGDGQSVTGGYVYRSSEIPGLRGYYFYGDYQSETVWIFRYDNGAAVDQQELSLPGSGGITSFGQDNRGNVYIVRYSGTIHKIVAQ